ncbi:MAG: ribonuclease HII [Polyangiales bacterium]|jgi:ribonuclease HII
MLVCGVDENGLGPLLGPLVATAATIEVSKYDAVKLQALGASAGVGDSKQHSAFGRMAKAESLTLALTEKALGRPARDADDLFEALTLEGRLGLRAPCPGGQTEKQCWSAPLPLPAFGGDPIVGHAMLDELKAGGVRVRRVRTTLSCASRINTALAQGDSKLQVDLGLFEDLLLDARGAERKNLLALCGMVGGIRKYENYFRRLSPKGKGQGAQAYMVPKLGEVRFEVKADDRHLPVGLASMVGKVVRELAMRRIVLFYQSHDTKLRDVSGYHDPVTKEFVEQTQKLRRRLKIRQACFER